jgi:hypothetical protein
MNAKHVALAALIALLSIGTLGCPTAMPTTTTTEPADTTEAPPVAVHTDGNASTNDTTGTNTDSGDTVTGSGDNTTTTTSSTDPDSTITPIDITVTDPNNATTDPDSTAPPSSTISGTFAGTLTWQTSQFLAGGSPFPSGSEDTPITIEFDENGVITAVFFRGFLDAPDGTAAVQQVGDKVTLSDGGLVQTVRVLEANYSDSGAFIKIRVRHQKDAGSLVETGVGIQTIDVSVSGDQLTYESTMTYDITFESAASPIGVGEISTTSGTLQHQ